MCVTPTARPGKAGAGRLRRNAFRIGIHDPSESVNGISRYVEAILDHVDCDEFDVVLFHAADGPHRCRPNLRSVPLPERRPTGTRPEPPATAGGSRDRDLLRQWYHRLAPKAVKLCCGYRRDALRLANLIRPHDLDLLSLQLVGGEAAALAGSLAGVGRVIGTLHIDSSQSTASEWLVECVTNHSLHQAIAVSQATKADWVRRTRIPARRVAVIPNGVDPQRFSRGLAPATARRELGLPAGDYPLIAAASRLATQKGLTYLLRAVAHLRTAYPETSVVIAGDGPLRLALEREARGLGLADNVFFVGFRHDVRPVLNAADVFALPSLWEALPFSLLEAMAAELPVVAARVAGVPEVVVAGETGFLVPPADALALAAALRPLLDSVVLRRRMGASGRARVLREFDLRNTVRRTLDLFRDALSAPSPARRPSY